MENNTKPPDRRTRMQTLNALFLGLGFVLFIALLARLDAREIMQQLGRIGWMMIPAFMAYVCSQLLSTITWKSCIEPGNVILIAILTQTASTLTVWATAFVPSQVGTLEGGNAAVFKLAGLDPVLGVTTVIARRVRTLVGVGIGLMLVGRVSWDIRRAARGSESD